MHEAVTIERKEKTMRSNVVEFYLELLRKADDPEIINCFMDRNAGYSFFLMQLSWLHFRIVQLRILSGDCDI